VVFRVYGSDPGCLAEVVATVASQLGRERVEGWVAIRSDAAELNQVLERQGWAVGPAPQHPLSP
jgi:hypothetical protein